MDENQGYEVPAEFERITNEPLLDFEVNDSTDLWLFQWPQKQDPDYVGKEVELKLGGHGKMGNVEGAPGREYHLVSSEIKESNATAFLSSALGSKIAGKLSRRVSVVHYPEPSELIERQELRKANSRLKNQRSSSIAFSSQKIPSHSTRTRTTATPARSTYQKGSRPINGRAASHRSSEHKSSLSEVGEPSQVRNKRHASPGRSNSGVTSSGQGRSTTTTSSGEMSSKKKQKR